MSKLLAPSSDEHVCSAERNRTLLEICRKMTCERELVPLLNLVSREAKELVEADRFTVFLLDEQTNQLWSPPTQERGSIRFDEYVGVTGTAFRIGQSINVPEAYQDLRFSKKVDLETGYRTRNLLALPLRDDAGNAIGVCEALNKKQGPFTKEDEEILELLSLHLANTIGTAQLLQPLTAHQNGKGPSAPKATSRGGQGSSILGQSKELSSALKLANRFAPYDVTVLITGETGTGKELFARYIHDNSSRRTKPFVACNLASFSETLLESELFGYVRGAFTGAQKDKKGLLEEAERGTLFLDEIGDLPLGLQVKLLRLLESQEYYRVGEASSRTADVRIIAATNKEFGDTTEEDGFRRDLYYRINGARVMLPPLRHRKEDILLMAENFIDQICDRIQQSKKGMSSSVHEALLSYSWPGNIRELKNAIESAVMLSDRDIIVVADLPFPIQQHTSNKPLEIASTALNKMDEVQKILLQSTLQRTKGNKGKAAEILGISTRTLYRKLHKFGIEV